ncbi:hypothetical protein MKX68_24080 [Paenibacillus sp. FSL M8-0212]
MKEDERGKIPGISPFFKTTLIIKNDKAIEIIRKIRKRGSLRSI